MGVHLEWMVISSGPETPTWPISSYIGDRYLGPCRSINSTPSVGIHDPNVIILLRNILRYWSLLTLIR